MLKVIPEKSLVLSGGMTTVYSKHIPDNTRLITSEKDLKQLFV
jgi:hypothetical protein